MSEAAGETARLQKKQLGGPGTETMDTTDSRLLGLHCMSPDAVTIEVHQMQTVDEAMETLAVEFGWPKHAGQWLRMEFSGVTLQAEQVPKQAGLCDGAQFSLLGKRSVEVQAEGINLLGAIKAQNVEDVQLAISIRPARVNRGDSNCMTPLQWAARTGTLQIARLLLDAGASVHKTDRVSSACLRTNSVAECFLANRQSLLLSVFWRINCLCC